MLTQCDERNRVIILLMYYTGMRIGALPDLRFRDISLVPEFSPYRIQVYARSKVKYYTMVSKRQQQKQQDLMKKNNMKND